ncbi:DUF2939 domain-containing protein [Thiospirillum jenense]|uniref:DUF2939 domain-containing protein n=1 Tax=Thiospirillum jenense TaxID=1653858 RepID=A0A839HDB4_9GAMM|nr:DUF2939 domain-containing protein [Thiospirillum jenense]MBB1126130.1 DUF2939 domain-containing protein [Thiospirillum jenense]
MRWRRRSLYVAAQFRHHRWRLSTRARQAIATVLILLVLFLLWPYWTLWCLNETSMSGNPNDLIDLVDFATVRDQIRRRLNKDSRSYVGTVSDAFVQWLEQSLRHNKSDVLEQVNAHWLHDLLRNAVPNKQGFLSAVSFAGFDLPYGFLIQIERGHASRISLLLQPHPIAWRVVAVYY